MTRDTNNGWHIDKLLTKHVGGPKVPLAKAEASSIYMVCTPISLDGNSTTLDAIGASSYQFEFLIVVPGTTLAVL